MTILHIVPLDSINEDKVIDIANLINQVDQPFTPISAKESGIAYGGYPCPLPSPPRQDNDSLFLSLQGGKDKPQSTIKLFNDGRIEVIIDFDIPENPNDRHYDQWHYIQLGEKTSPKNNYQECLINGINRYLKALKDNDIIGLAYLFITLRNMQEVKTEKRYRERGIIKEKHLDFEPQEIHLSKDCDAKEILSPIFEKLHNDFGVTYEPE